METVGDSGLAREPTKAEKYGRGKNKAAYRYYVALVAVAERRVNVLPNTNVLDSGYVYFGLNLRRSRQVSSSVAST